MRERSGSIGAEIFLQYAQPQKTFKQMKKLLKLGAIIVGLVAIAWWLATWYVQQPSPARLTTYGFNDCQRVALVVYDADPFYNLDERVSRSFAKGLVSQDWTVQVGTVTGVEGLTVTDYDLLTVCANTYNFTLDKAIQTFISSRNLTGQPTYGMVVGSGSTQTGVQQLTKLLTEARVDLWGIEQFWVFRSNDETQSEKENLKAAEQKAYQLGVEIGAWHQG